MLTKKQLLTLLLLPALLAPASSVQALSTTQKKLLFSCGATIAAAAGVYHACPKDIQPFAVFCAAMGGIVGLSISAICAQFIFTKTTPELIADATKLHTSTLSAYGNLCSRAQEHNPESLRNAIHKIQPGAYRCLSLCRDVTTINNRIATMINNLTQRQQTLAHNDDAYQEIGVVIQKLDTLAEQLETLVTHIKASSCYDQECADERFALEEQERRYEAQRRHDEEMRRYNEQRWHDQKLFEQHHYHKQTAPAISYKNYVFVQPTVVPQAPAKKEEPIKVTPEKKPAQPAPKKTDDTKKETTRKAVEKLIDNGDIFNIN